MKKEVFLKELKEMEKDLVKGWDFSKFDQEIISEKKSWNYEVELRKYLKADSKILDMGTGGGEFVLSLNHPHHLTSVTEAYVPNFKLCQERLSPLGITVKQTYKDNLLPFDDNSFDVIINRHTSFELKEVKRTLKNGGYFITQQVGNENNKEIVYKITKEEKIANQNNSLGNRLSELKKIGFETLKSQEEYRPVQFKTMRAIVFYGKNIVWDFPDFSVEKYLDNLIECQKEISENGHVKSKEHRYLLVARK